jgi:hypothetical protein
MSTSNQTRTRRGRRTARPRPVRIKTTPNHSSPNGDEPVCGRFGGVPGTVVVVVVEP